MINFISANIETPGEICEVAAVLNVSHPLCHTPLYAGLFRQRSSVRQISKLRQSLEAEQGDYNRTLTYAFVKHDINRNS